MVDRRLEVRPLPALLPPGTSYVERAVLPSPAADTHDATPRRHPLPLRLLPLQLRKLPPL